MTPIDLQTENRIRSHRNGQIGFAFSGWAGGAFVATAIFCAVGAATDTGAGRIAGAFFALSFTMAALFMYRGTRRYLTEHMETFDIRERRRQCLERTNANFRMRVAVLTGRLLSQQSTPGVAGEAGGDEGLSPPATYEGRGQIINWQKPR